MTTVPPVSRARKVRRCMEGEKTSRPWVLNGGLPGSYAPGASSVTLGRTMGQRVPAKSWPRSKRRRARVGRALARGGRRAARIGVTVTFVDTPEPRTCTSARRPRTCSDGPSRSCSRRDPLGQHRLARPGRGPPRERLHRASRGEQGQRTYELRVMRKDGREVPLEVTASHATIEGRRAVVAFIIDASARREAEAQRRAQRGALPRAHRERARAHRHHPRRALRLHEPRVSLKVLGYPDADDALRVPLSSTASSREQALVRAQRERGRPRAPDGRSARSAYRVPPLRRGDRPARDQQRATSSTRARRRCSGWPAT